MEFSIGWSPPLAATRLSFLILGGLVAADRPMSEREGVVLAVALGAFHGQMNGVEMAVANIGLLGPVATLFVCVALVTGLVVSLRPTMDPDHVLTHCTVPKVAQPLRPWPLRWQMRSR